MGMADTAKVETVETAKYVCLGCGLVYEEQVNPPGAYGRGCPRCGLKSA